MRADDERLILAIEEGDISSVRSLLDRGANIDAQSPNDWTPLLTASRDQPEIVELLLRRGANPNLCSNKGYTPLMRAAGHGAIAIIERLLANGADLDAVDDGGQSALDMAYAERQPEAIAVLQRAVAAKKSTDGAPPSAPSPTAPKPAPASPQPFAFSAAPLRILPIFVSSTFRDMHAERDYIRNVILPVLQERVRDRRVVLELIDLRWGVDATVEREIQKKNLLILKVCFDEIKRSHPRFISLIGDRYGWIPPLESLRHAIAEAGFDIPVDGRSLTELEILFSVQQLISADHFLCYMRDSLPYEQLVACGQMTREKAAIFSNQFDTAGGEAATRCLDSLKSFLGTQFPHNTHRYSVSWNPSTQAVEGLGQWGTQLTEDLWRGIDADTRQYLSKSPETWEQLERRIIESYCSQVASRKAVRRATLQQLSDFAIHPRRPSDAWAHCLVGTSGSGKSVLLAHLASALQSSGVAVLSHFVGLTDKSTSVLAMYQRWFQELAPFDNEAQTSAAIDNVVLAFWRRLRRVSAGRPFVLIVDNAEAFAPYDRRDWYSTFAGVCPPNVHVFFTSGDTHSGLLARRSGVAIVDLPPLSEDDCRSVISSICQTYHRTLPTSVTDTLLGRPQECVKNSRWLSVAVEELNLIGREEFEQSDATASAANEEQRLVLLLEQTVSAFPPSIDALYESVIARVHRLDPEWTPIFAKVLALSPEGLASADLPPLLAFMSNFGADQARVVFLRRNFRAQLRYAASEGVYQFSELTFARAVLRYYRVMDAEKAVIQGRIARYLQSSSHSDPSRLRQMMFHLIESGDQAETARQLAQLIDTFFSRYSVPYAQSASARQLAELINTPEETKFWEPSLGALTAVTQAIVRRGDAGIPWLVSFLRDPCLTARQRGRIIETIHNVRPYLLHDQLSLEDQRTLYQSFVSILDEIPAAERDDTLLKIPIACQFELGRIALAVGDPLKACASLAAALRIAEVLSKSPGAASEPTWDDKLAAIHTTMGRSLAALGKIDEAIASFQNAIRARESVTGAPVVGEAGNDIVECLIYIGELQETARRYDQALRSFREAYQQARVAGIDLPREKLDLAMSLAREREGALLLELGDLDAAARAFAEVRKMRVALRDFAATPNNVFNAAVSSEKLGDIRVAQGMPVEALEAYREARDAYQSVSAADPDNTTWSCAVGTAWGAMANVLLELNQLPQARAAYDQQLRIFDHLRSVAPGDVHIVRRYFTAMTNYGELESRENRLDAAKPYYEKALAVAQRLHEVNPHNPTALRDLVVILMKSAINATRRRDLEAAIGYYTRALDPSESMIRLAPTDRKLRTDRAGLLWNLAQVYSDSGESDKSISVLYDCHAMLKALLQTGRLNPPLDQIYDHLKTVL